MTALYTISLAIVFACAFHAMDWLTSRWKEL